MSAKPSDELGGSEEKWFGDDYERNGLFGSSTPSGFGELRDEFEPMSADGGASDLDRQFNQFQDDVKRPAVAMETASTDDSMSGLFRKPMSDDGDLYTSLLSNQNFPTSQEASYLSEELKPSKTSPTSTSHLQFSTTSSTTSSSKTVSYGEEDLPRSLLGSDKTESYNYMDISHGDELLTGQRPDPLDSLMDTKVSSTSGHDSLGGYMDQIPGRDVDQDDDDEEEEEEDENLGPACDSHSFPYVEEPSDEEMSDYRSYRNLGGTSETASPVKITLTQSQTPAAEPESQPPPRSSPVGGTDRENVLSVGTVGVPTVTLSEPEDDSPASTPSPSPTDPDFPSHEMYNTNTVKRAPSKNSAAAKGPSKEPGASSNESGDSEIELVTEDPAPRGQTSPSTKSSSGPFPPSPVSKSPVTPPGNPFDGPPVAKGGHQGLAASLGAGGAYSILREEREAELDSELFIESASEESPKREQGGAGPKQAAALPSPLVPVVTAPPARSPLEEKPPAGPPVQAPEAVKAPAAKTPEEERPSKPKPPMAAVPPEVRSAEKPPPQEDGGSQKTCGGEVKGDLAAPAGTVLLQNFDKQKAVDLLYWRNVKQSGGVFSSVLLLLFSLTQFSVVSVGAYLALAALSATISFRIYKSVLQAVQKTDEGHPFKSFLEVEIALSQDQIGKYADKIMLYSNTCMKELRRLFLVQDLVDSLKFAVLMWLLTYVGALFNGLTLLILAVICMFTMPVIYEKHQAQIDQYVGLIRTQVNSVVGKIQAKIPGAKRKEE
ncbi:reticulon-1a isoform X1 [Gadus morhua]|uniref:Reticulon n=1 Tax=Gadus morhua TaxID=8049 RepID=A0A8C5AZ99_GADMO|nr:reticulon-1 isoform X1 [Gadus morhua]